MPFGDIIVIAAVAAFIILRYRSVLGQKTGRDMSKPPAPKPAEMRERVIQLPDRNQPKKEAPAAQPQTIKDPLVAARFNQMVEMDPELSEAEFIAGAKGAFDMIIEAFRKEDKGTLKMLLSSTLYKQFEDEIANRQTASVKQETTLVSVLSAEITNAELDKSTARITLRFVSEQIHVARDKEGKVTEGDASKVQHVEDSWTFERDLKSRNPNWTIIDT